MPDSRALLHQSDVDRAISNMALRLRLRDYAEDVIAVIAGEVRLVLDDLNPDDGLCPHGRPPEFCGNCHEDRPSPDEQSAKGAGDA